MQTVSIPANTLCIRCSEICLLFKGFNIHRSLFRNHSQHRVSLTLCSLLRARQTLPIYCHSVIIRQKASRRLCEAGMKISQMPQIPLTHSLKPIKMDYCVTVRLSQAEFIRFWFMNHGKGGHCDVTWLYWGRGSWTMRTSSGLTVLISMEVLWTMRDDFSLSLSLEGLRGSHVDNLRTS